MMHSQLNNKVIVITGALGVLGSAATRLFLERGASIAACDIRTSDEDGGMSELLTEYGGRRLLYIPGDMTSEADVDRLFRRIEDHFGRLDGLYHNVFVNKSATIANQAVQDWEESIRGTLTSTFLVNKHSARSMRQNGGGSIVNTSSIMGSVPAVENAAYGAGKAAVEQLTRVAAVEFAPWGIRVNAIAPGDFKSEQVLAQASDAQAETMRRLTLIGRSGRPNEINELAAFLLSDAGSYATGSIFPVTGGFGLCR